jgi:hypothetical protein
LEIYKVRVGNCIFKCKDKEGIDDLLDALFSYSIDRKLLYENIIIGGGEKILQSESADESPAIEYIRSMKLLQQKYGKKYDPNTQMMSVFDPSGSI